MKIFLISHDLSGNALGRTVLLAQLLSRRHRVEIIGAAFGSDIWYPARKTGFKYRKVDGEIFLPEYTHLFARLIDKLKGDLVLAVKPRPTSFGVALMGRELTDRPVLLDIDDLEMAYYEDKGWKEWDRKLLLRRPNSPLYTQMLERLVPTADGISVASRNLQERYGGTYLTHVKDPDFLDPAKYDKMEERRKRHLSPDEKLVFFVGSPREHKGLGLLQSAINRLDREDVRLVVFGMTNRSDDPIEQELREKGGDRFHGFKQFPFSDLPAVLSMADIVAIPQEDTAYATAQMPSKLFDAMSMAKPIVATAVSDIPEVLGDDCGKVVPPSDEEALSVAIGDLLESPLEAERVGNNAREGLIKNYSFEAIEDRVDTLLAEVASGGGQPLQPEFEAVRADPIMGPYFEKALHSPHWETASPDASIPPEQWKLRLRKFKPSRRACFTAEFPSTNGSKKKKFGVKVWHSKRGKAINHRLEEIKAEIDRSECVVFQAPKPLFYDSKAHALAYPWLKGVPLTKHLRECDDVDWIVPLADALAFLHRIMLPDLPDRLPAQEIQSVHSLMEADDRKEFRREMERRILEPLSESLPRSVRSVSLHRDLYDQQVLLGKPAGVTLIDLDDMAKGDPMLDVGNLLAHLHLIEKAEGGRLDIPRIEGRFLDAYTKKANIDLKDIEESVRWYKTISLARLSALQFKRGNIDESRLLFSLARRNYFRDSQVTIKEAM